MSLFPVFTPAAASVATISYIGVTFDSANQTTYTFSSHAIGTAAANRKVVVGVKTFGVNTTTVNSVTVGGNSATQRVEAGDGFSSEVELWDVDVSTGTTADIVVTNGSGKGGCVVSVWAVYGAAASPTATVTSAASPLALTLSSIPAGGVAIGWGYNNSSGTYTWANLTEDNDAEADGGYRYSGASDAFATEQTSLAITATPSAGVGDGVAASWGPA